MTNKLGQLTKALEDMTNDAEHLTLILEGRACEEWDYKYQHERIANARKLLNAIDINS